MATASPHPEPPDAAARRAVEPVLVYALDSLPPFDWAFYDTVRSDLTLVAELIVPPRDAGLSKSGGAPVSHRHRQRFAGRRFEPVERYRPARTVLQRQNPRPARHPRQHRRRLWSALPWLRPMATITHDTLDWYGIDEFGAGVHDVIGTRCDPYTNFLLAGDDYHYCCHSNLTRALAAARHLPLAEAEAHVHDVVNVFMCTGYTRDANQYFMKASPSRAGDFIELFAEMDLLAGLSACPGGDCSAGHSSDDAGAIRYGWKFTGRRRRIWRVGSRR